ncbi:adenosine deaminase 2 [Scaptodrosophila lebanonensis]|uniref:Adenosine deaminase n=1 Tax=Drosophila lebanonensis TaxID=7225 RepID=A0A6J2U9W2_DROLE|nr:adenosine deaminase 2 [Scaptodrosophila lebanonensis]
MDTKSKWEEPWRCASSQSPIANYPLQLPRTLRIEAPMQPNTSKWRNTCANISVVVLLFMMLLALLWALCLNAEYYRLTPEQRFERTRARFVGNERRMQVGGKLRLTPREELANEQLLAIKTVDNELHNIWSDYQPRPHFLSKYNISETDLYGLLRSMPKGGLLHVHDAGMFKTELLIELTYRRDLWACVAISGEFEDFRFSNTFPNIPPSGDYKCNWQLMSNFWANQHSNEYLDKLRASLSLDSQNYMSSEDLAKHMQRAHRLIHGLITFRQHWPNFLFRMMEDLYADGVNYVELRSSLPVMYDLKGTNYTILDTAQSLVTTANIFRYSYSDFVGIKLIYAPIRDYKDSRMDTYIENARLLKKHYPNLFVGFDLLSFGNECQLPPLGKQLQLLHIDKEIDFYFHAGDSRCLNSTGSDDNLIDALLLGSKRLGNAMNVPQHPEVLHVLRLLDIAVEVCPLSNHYLQYMNDFRMHPAAYLIAAGFPIVVGSDYPYFWNAAPLTDDFYVAFVGIASEQGNLRLLKQLAMNSFMYSALNVDERREALLKWRTSWNRWLETFVNNN